MDGVLARELNASARLTTIYPKQELKRGDLLNREAAFGF